MAGLDEKQTIRDEAEFLRLARKRFKRASEREAKSRERVKDNRKMRSGDQWPEWAEKQRDADKRPCLTFNYINTLLRQITGDLRQNKMRMKARAANDGAMHDADIDNAVLKHIEYISNADNAYDWAVEQAGACGFAGYFRLLHDYSGDNPFEQDIFIERVKDSLSVYGDPDFKKLDASDRNYYFITDKQLREEFEKEYPGKSTSDNFDTNGDTESWFTEEYITKAEYWYRESVMIEYGIDADGVFEVEKEPERKPLKTRKVKSYKVYQCIISGSEILEEPTEYPCSVIPIFPVFGEEILTDDGVIYKSAVEDAYSAQQLYNFSKTNAAELLALQPKAPYIGTDKMFEGHPEWDDANLRTYSKLAFKSDPQMPGQKPERQPFATVPTGEMAVAESAKLDMEELASVHKASRGMASNETSGRAILARKEGDDTANFYLVDNLRRAIESCARVIMEMKGAIYDTARILKIVGEDGSLHSQVPINQYAVPEKKGSKTTFTPADESTYGAVYLDATKSKSAVYVEAGPSSSTQRQDAAEKLGELMQAAGGEGIAIWPEVIKAQDFPDADEIARTAKEFLIKKGLRDPDPDENGNQQPNPALVAQQQQAQAQAQLEQGKLQLEAGKLDLEQQKLSVEMQKIQKEYAAIQAEMQHGADGSFKINENVSLDRLLPALLPNEAVQLIAKLGIQPDIEGRNALHMAKIAALQSNPVGVVNENQGVAAG